MPSDAGTPCGLIYLHSTLDTALERLSKHEVLEAPIHRSFVVGGASLYRDTLSLAPSASAFVDRVLLTRILSPAFESCDVFVPDFLEEGEKEGRPWRQTSHKELQEWVGFEVPEGTQEENGVQYEFQMWVR